MDAKTDVTALFGWTEEKKEPKKAEKEKPIRLEFSKAEYNVLLNGFCPKQRRKPKEVKELLLALARLLALKRIEIVKK